jgi:hypothetical protein
MEGEIVRMKKKIIALAVTAALIIAVFVGAELGKTQKTIRTPSIVKTEQNK